MSEVVIKVESLSKQYRLGSVGTGSFAHDLNRTWHWVRGNEDTYLMIGETNDRIVQGRSEYVWALQDSNIEVKKGEILVNHSIRYFNGLNELGLVDKL